MSAQPQWRLIAQLGDVSYDEYGGYFIYVDDTGVYPPEAEKLVVNDEPATGDRFNDDGKQSWTIYRFQLEKCTYIDGVLSDNPYHPGHCVWYDTTPAKMAERPQDGKGLADVASFADWDVNELREALCGDDIIARAKAYDDIGSYHGFDEFDNYPIEESSRFRVVNRYRHDLKRLRLDEADKRRAQWLAELATAL